VTSQRVPAALSTERSCQGRAITPRVPPASAASCNRRDPAMSSPLPSAMTALTPGQRSATSIAQKRDEASGGSIQTDDPSSKPIESGDGQHRLPIQTIGRDCFTPFSSRSESSTQRATCASTQHEAGSCAA
jgi:hypothetical protein